MAANGFLLRQSTEVCSLYPLVALGSTLFDRKDLACVWLHM
jgi:hypothetical protein